MGLYRKKPVVIEAERFSREKHFDGKHCTLEGVQVRREAGGVYVFYVLTLEGEMRVGEGDWVITGVAGERYPCKNDIFERTYEPAG